MSCNEEEAGSYLLAVGQFKKMKSDFAVFWKKLCESQFVQISSKVASANKFSIKELKVWGENDWDTPSSWHDRPEALRRCLLRNMLNKTLLKEGEVEFLMDNFVVMGTNAKIKLPQKKTLNELTKRDLSGYYKMLQGSEWQLGFDDKSTHVTWTVCENSHSVRDAREEPVAEWFFKYLSKLEWKGKKGGYIAYTSEYHTEDGPCDPEWRNVYGWAKTEQDKRFKIRMRRR